ncbi:MAG: tRNA (adenosine(37)-N6)-dimethylallyltransferase MiaA [bacterium]
MDKTTNSKTSHFALLIAGPTASGKSAAALSLADELNGEIINADSIQIYKDLLILTARPDAQEEARVPHHLYGTIDGNDIYSAGRWSRAALACMEDVCQRGKVPILVGGTGLYFKALEEGFSPIPEIDLKFREQGNRLYQEIGPEAFRKKVIEMDPAMEQLPAGDRQRLVRAFEVFAATGQPLSKFQAQPRQPLLSIPAVKAILQPTREELYKRCDQRLDNMVERGAIDEVNALLARNIPDTYPVMKALGVPEISRFVRGEASIEQALDLAKRNTRRFAKRQLTWFRNQTSHWPSAEHSEGLIELLLEAIQKR